MADSSSSADRRGILAAAVSAVLLLLGGGFVARALAEPGPPPQPATATASSTSPAGRTTPSVRATAQAPPTAQAAPDTRAPGQTTNAGAPRAVDFGPLMPPSKPVALRIRAIGVDTQRLVELEVDSSGRLQAPEDFDAAGWYSGGPTPGEFGPAVIGGHVDSKRGPAVFYRLGALHKGDRVDVTRADRSTARFVIDRVARYAKAQFPTAAVYGNTTDRAELRLITCGGAFDQTTGHYIDNIVAFGHLVNA
jgi:sortase family protein